MVGVRAPLHIGLRDWLFSRQRYWGEPFPIVYDETGLPIALPESMLPVELPDTDDFSPRSYPPDDADSMPEPPLGRLTDWVTVTLDLGDGPRAYRRETNTMPNWAGSCWYELRYLDPTNDASTGRSAASNVIGWGRTRIALWAALICTSAGWSTPCCTCCTPGSGTRCSTTWATCRVRSRSTDWSTRATSRHTRTPIRAVPTCRPPEVVEKVRGV